MESSSGPQRINGLDLWVHRHRDPEATPSGLTVLLVHGFLDSGATWDLVAPTLARAGHEVLAPDLRGFGQSAWVGAGGYYHFPDYVADLSALIDSVAPARLALVGHSMGGTAAALLAGARPERFERVALLEGLGPLASEPEMAVERMKVWLRHLREATRKGRPLASLDEATERLALHHPRVPRDVLASRAALLTRKDSRGHLVWAYDPLHRSTAPIPFNLETFRVFLRRIDCPTLVVSGGPTGWHPPDEAERATYLRTPRLLELPGAGHMMHWTAPDALAKSLLDFFAEAPSSPTKEGQSSD